MSEPLTAVATIYLRSADGNVEERTIELGQEITVPANTEVVTKADYDEFMWWEQVKTKTLARIPPTDVPIIRLPRTRRN